MSGAVALTAGALLSGALATLSVAQQAAAPADEKEEVAFELLLEGMNLESTPILVSEWDRYASFLRRQGDVVDEGLFIPAVLRPLLETHLVRAHYGKFRDEWMKRAEAVVRDLESGMPFAKVVRAHTDDRGTRPNGGLTGKTKRMFFAYPTHLDLFEKQIGEWGGPYFTKSGVKFFYVEDRGGQPGTPNEWIQPRYLLIKYKRGPALGGADWTSLWLRTRLRTNLERFRRILPPGMLVDPPEQFGPSDVAPIGDPERLLIQFSENDDLHGKLRQPNTNPRRVNQSPIPHTPGTKGKRKDGE